MPPFSTDNLRGLVAVAPIKVAMPYRGRIAWHGSSAPQSQKKLEVRAYATWQHRWVRAAIASP